MRRASSRTASPWQSPEPADRKTGIQYSGVLVTSNALTLKLGSVGALRWFLGLFRRLVGVCFAVRPQFLFGLALGLAPGLLRAL